MSMQPVALSVNLNKVALVRNSRGSNMPDLLQVARDCESYGAKGITVHPRPDERHVRYVDVYQLKQVVQTELNVEGFPSDRFINMILEVKPDQCTLVPDDPGQLTSDHGWDFEEHSSFLGPIIRRLQSEGIRVSVFVDADPEAMASAKKTGTDRIELYTGPYAQAYSRGDLDQIRPYTLAAEAAMQLGMGVNAGHDLNLDNLRYFYENIPGLQEVSIGHALVSDALYYGFQNVIGMYNSRLRPTSS